ncbi:nucleotidyltransferase domain-containing protein [Phyllobacterium sp. UNC302MFCol5.2]|uniref:GSU2403 family nucleotidyltransferase fold protein n=1 Tax=Phyllobacterium sp. UNC302MFCol5.2 TaxID=1449065 RepID=UPI000481DC17|nr:nucleotidyltransferase domain-containing protein [Phyllobacterium sp. UNC302MFCol5.2]
MNNFNELSPDQIRQLVNTEQVYESYKASSKEYEQRFSGSMSWKTSTNGKEYLYKKSGGIWKSLGPRSTETETTFGQFHAGRENSKERVGSLAQRLDELAPVNRAMSLGRVPQLTARIIRALDKLGLIGTAIDIVGTNALFVYERLAGGHVTSGLLSTQDVDLLMDSRFSLRLIGRTFSQKGLIGILQKVDHSFAPLAKNSYRAANRDGFLVDLIKPTPKNIMSGGGRSGFSSDDEDLRAVEIEGLAWLVNSPKVSAVVIDQRGYPLTFSCPDPRAFALHKLWLSRRADRDAAKRSRDGMQARVVAELIRRRLTHLHFGSEDLRALPAALRRLAEEFNVSDSADEGSLTPNW